MVPVAEGSAYLGDREVHGEDVPMEENMDPCIACRKLAGQFSAVRPHENLHMEGTGVFGTPHRPIRRYVQYRCTSCGSWLRQNTADGSPAGLWSVQCSPGRQLSGTAAEPANPENARFDNLKGGRQPEEVSGGVSWPVPCNAAS